MDHEGRALPGRPERPLSLQLIFSSAPSLAVAAMIAAASHTVGARSSAETSETTKPAGTQEFLRRSGGRHATCWGWSAPSWCWRCVFNFVTEGRFLTPRNVFNLTIQTVSVAIMATGMVFIIVTRHIDLSRRLASGHLFGDDGDDPDVLPATMARARRSATRSIAPIAILVGLATGIAIGAFQGWLVGYLAIPAFIVTLGGLLVWRNVAWYLTNGQTIGPLDETFLLFGGINGTLGETGSWILGVLGVAAAVVGLWQARRAKIGHEFPVKPLWAEVARAERSSRWPFWVSSWILNSYQVPDAAIGAHVRGARRGHARRDIPKATAFPIPSCFCLRSLSS